MLAICIIFLSLFVRFCFNFISRRAHIGQMPTFSTIITLSLMATPFSHFPEENVLLRLTSTMVIAPGEGAVCHLCTNSSGVFHYIF